MLLLFTFTTTLLTLATFTLTTQTHSAPTPTPVRLLLTDWISSIDDPVTAIDVSYFRVSSFFFQAVIDFNNRDVEMLPALAAVRSCQKNLSVAMFCDEAGSTRRAALLVSEFKNQVDAVVGFASLWGAVEGALLADADLQVPVVSHWSTAYVLNDRARFNNFARVVVSDSDYVTRLAAFVSDSLSLSAAAIIYLNTDSAPFLAQALVSEFRERSVTSQMFGFTLGDAESISRAVKAFRKTSIACVIIFAYISDMQAFADAFVGEGLGDSNGVVVVHTNLDVLPTDDDIAASANLTTFFQGAFAVRDGIVETDLFHAHVQRSEEKYASFVPWINSLVPPLGTADQVGQGCKNNKLNLTLSADYFSSQITVDNMQDVWARAYDSVIATGLAACAVDPGPGAVTGRQIQDALPQVDFVGLSGRVKFNADKHSRDAATQGFVLVNWKRVNASSAESTEDEETVSSSTVGTFDAVAGTWNFTATLEFRGGLNSAPPSYVHPVADPSHLPDGIKVLAYIELAVVQVLCLFAGVWLAANARRRLVLAAQPELLAVVVVGVSLASWSILALSVDGSPSLLEPINADLACLFGPVCFFLGMMVALVALAAKGMRTARMFAKNKNKLLHVGPPRWKVYAGVALVVVVELAVLLAWVGSNGKLVWATFVTARDRFGSPVVTVSECYPSGNPLVGAGFVGFFVIAHVLMLGVAWQAARSTKEVPMAMDEARWQTLLTAALAQIFVLAVATTAAVYDTPLARFVVLTTFVFVSCLALLFFGLVPRAVRVWRGVDKNRVEGVTLTMKEEEGEGDLGPSKFEHLKADEVSLSVGLRTATVRDKFAAVCDEFQESHSLLFVLDVQAWRDAFPSRTLAWRRESSEALYATYLSPWAVMRVDVLDDVRTEVWRGIVEVEVDKGGVGENVFDAAFNAVTAGLERGPWRHFVREGGLFAVSVSVEAREAKASGKSMVGDLFRRSKKVVRGGVGQSQSGVADSTSSSERVVVALGEGGESLLVSKGPGGGMVEEMPRVS